MVISIGDFFQFSLKMALQNNVMKSYAEIAVT
jgi:hypothetical protein